jgi:hypothetical protein
MLALGAPNYNAKYSKETISKINSFSNFRSHKPLNDSINKVVVAEGTPVSLQLLQDVSSKTANVGDVLDFETNKPVIVGDRVLIPEGAKAFGKVTEVERRKGFGKAGKLNFTIEYLILANGKVIKLSSEVKGIGKNKAGAAIAEAVLLTPLFLLKKGKNVSFDKGKIFKVFVEQDYELAISK